MSLLKPDLYLSDIFEIDPPLLRRLGIKALLLDVDNTMCIFRTHTPVPGVLEWIKTMRGAGVELYILSNAKPERLIKFAKKVNLPYFYLSAKPFPFKINKAIKKMGYRKSEVAMVGDQIFTDVLGGNLAGITTIWLDFIELEDGFSFKIRRKIEEKLKKTLKKGTK